MKSGHNSLLSNTYTQLVLERMLRMQHDLRQVQGPSRSSAVAQLIHSQQCIHLTPLRKAYTYRHTYVLTNAYITNEVQQ